MTDTRVSILLVEDSEFDARLLREELEHDPPQRLWVRRAQTLQEATHVLGTHAPDVVLLDLSLPDSSGLDTVLRMNAAAPHLPLVVLTGAADERIGLEAVRHGAQDYLIKGQADARLIVRSIRYAIARKKEEIALQHARDELEHKVRERTRALALTVEELQAEVRQRLLAEGAMRVSKQQLEEVVHHAPVMILAVDNQGVYTLAEGRLEPLGLTSQQIVGRHFSAVVGDHPQVFKHFERSKAGEHVAAELVLGDVIFEAHYAPVRDASGQVSGVICVATDITQRRRVEREVLEATEREQWRIGRDLHDSIQGSLAGLGLMLGALKQKIHRGTEALPLIGEIDQLSAIVQQTLAQTRALARGLCPVDLRADGLTKALEQLTATTSDLFHVHCRFSCPLGLRLKSETLAGQLYYISQEAINNGLKHARARNITVTLHQQPNALALTIEDDGIGLPMKTPLTKGLGLRTMDYRARLIGATLTVDRAATGGTCVRCEVPGRHADGAASKATPAAPASTAVGGSPP